MRQTKFNVLLVDDVEIDIMLQERAFRSEAPELTVASCLGSGEAAEKILSGDYDLVLLDINMPGKTGFDVLSEVRENRPGTHPIIIMFSSSDDPRDV
ncbi:MAG: response regulator, partial [Pseudomonadota bacterium]